MLIRIAIPRAQHAKHHPFFFGVESGNRFSVKDLKKPQHVTQMEIIDVLTISKNHETQPILVTTKKGGFLVQAQPTRKGDASARFTLSHVSLPLLTTPISGVYPLYGLVGYEKECNASLVNRLKRLGDRNLSIIDE